MKLQSLSGAMLLVAIVLGMGVELEVVAEAAGKTAGEGTGTEVEKGAIAQRADFAFLEYRRLYANAHRHNTQVPQPANRVDPTQPIQIQLLNYSGLPLHYSLVADEIEPRRLAAGDSVLLSDFSLPASISVQPTQARVNLKYDLAIEANRVILKLRRVSEVSPGDKAFDIQQSGDIYIHSQGRTFW